MCVGLFSCSSKDQLQSSQSPLPSLANLGSERVGQFMGEEPSGRGYDEIALDANGQPHNPMINRFEQQQSIFEEVSFQRGDSLCLHAALHGPTGAFDK